MGDEQPTSAYAEHGHGRNASQARNVWNENAEQDWQQYEQHRDYQN